MTNQSNSIWSYLRKRGFDVDDGRKVNKIMVAFLKAKGLPHTRWNNKYKGLYTPDVRNAPAVQANFEDFKEFMITYKQ